MKQVFHSIPVFIGLLFILVALQASFSIYSLFLIGKTYDESPDMNVSGTMRMLTHRLGRSAMEILAGHGSSDLLMQMENDIKRFKTLAAGLDYGNSQLNIRALQTEEETKILQAIIHEWSTYEQSLARIMYNGESITHAEQSLLITELTSSGDRIVASIDELIFVSQKTQRDTIEEITTRSLVVALVITIMIIFILHQTLKKGIMEPIKRVLPGLTALVKGGLPQKVKPRGCSVMIELSTVHNQLIDTRKLLLDRLTDDLHKVVENTQLLISLSLRISATVQNIESLKSEDLKVSNYVPEALQTLKQLEKELQLLQATTTDDNRYLIETSQHLLGKLGNTFSNIDIQVNTLQEQITYLVKNQDKSQEHLKKLETAATETLKMITKLISYARSFRTSLEPLETSLTDKQLLDLYITEQHLSRQQLHLFVLGYGQISPDDLGLQSLTKWINTRGQELFTNHPRFVSLNKHYDNYREILSRLLDSDTQAQKAENLALIENFSSMIIVDLEGLSNALEERNLQGA